MSIEVSSSASEAVAGGPRRIVITGGPGAGKTAVLEVVRREFHEHVVVLSEAASIIFGGGFPRRSGRHAVVAAQLAIYHVQNQLERLAMGEAATGLVLCDRGTLDGLAYWPESHEAFWREVGSTRERELARYTTVIHLRTPSARNGYNHANPLRIESAAEAHALDERILAAWEGHPHRVIVPSTANFVDKLSMALAVLRALLPPSTTPTIEDPAAPR